jgi:hypothetical protein
MHVSKIMVAIEALSANAPLAATRPGDPARSGDSPRKNVFTEPGGAKFACFLSHHKASCAMEGELTP